MGLRGVGNSTSIAVSSRDKCPVSGFEVSFSAYVKNPQIPIPS